MYISGGENVYPAEVERIIEKIAGVAEVSVIGQPDDKWGETGHAFVVSDGTRQFSAEWIIGQCKLELAGYKVPKHISFIDCLPRNATGKVDLKALRKRCSA